MTVGYWEEETEQEAEDRYWREVASHEKCHGCASAIYATGGVVSSCAEHTPPKPRRKGNR